jgi:hypothetical protein
MLVKRKRNLRKVNWWKKRRNLPDFSPGKKSNRIKGY